MSVKKKVSPVELPDGETGFVRVMTLRELNAFRALASTVPADSPDRDAIAAESLVAVTACDEAGNRLVPVGQEGSVAEWDYPQLVAYFQKAAEANGIVEKKG